MTQGFAHSRARIFRPSRGGLPAITLDERLMAACREEHPGRCTAERRPDLDRSGTIGPTPHSPSTVKHGMHGDPVHTQRAQFDRRFCQMEGGYPRTLIMRMRITPCSPGAPQSVAWRTPDPNQYRIEDVGLPTSPFSPAKPPSPFTAPRAYAPTSPARDARRR